MVQQHAGDPVSFQPNQTYQGSGDNGLVEYAENIGALCPNLAKDIKLPHSFFHLLHPMDGIPARAWAVPPTTVFAWVALEIGASIKPFVRALSAFCFPLSLF